MTLAADRIPVKIALLDNKKLGMIRQWQEIIYAGNYHSAHLPGPDYVKLAEAYGIPAFKATTHRRGRRGDQGRPGHRRAGADLVRDRRGAERVPDDAGGQGPVRPDRDLGGARGMSTDQNPNGQHPQPAHTSAPPPRALPGHRRGRAPHPRGPGDGPAGRAQPRREPDAGAQLQHRLAGRLADRPATHQPDDDHAPRRRRRRRAGGQAALPADRRAQGPGRHAATSWSSTSSPWSRSGRPTPTGPR